MAQWSAENYDLDINSGIAGEIKIINCLCPLIDVLQLKIHWGGVQLYLVLAS